MMNVLQFHHQPLEVRKLLPIVTVNLISQSTCFWSTSLLILQSSNQIWGTSLQFMSSLGLKPGLGASASVLFTKISLWDSIIMGSVGIGLELHFQQFQTISQICLVYMCAFSRCFKAKKLYNNSFKTWTQDKH